jgi:CRP/FNR family cyclic AMP-dependent transcriptional regulator
MTFELSAVNLRDFPLFDNIEDPVARQFLCTGFRFQYEAGVPLVLSADMGETFFLIVAGLAKLMLINAYSEPINVTLLRAGDFFGELAILEDEPLRTANIIAVSEIDVVAIHKREFMRMVYQFPAFAVNITRVLGRRLRAMNARIVAQCLPDLQKVAKTLVSLSEKGRYFEDAGTVLLPPLPLKEWAMFCYTSHDVFIQNMEYLREAGILEWQNQRIVIKNIDRLCQYADRPFESIETETGNFGPVT